MVSSTKQKFLCDYASRGNLSKCRELIESGVQVDASDSENKTPLHRAVCNNHIQVTKYLLEMGANPNAKDNFEMSPLHYAAEQGNSMICKQLISSGAKIDALNFLHETPLHCSILLTTEYENCVLFKNFVKTGSASTTRTRIFNFRPNRSPPHVETEKNRFQTVKCLLVEGANPNARDGMYRTPLHNAAEKNRIVDIYSTLIKHGAEIDPLDSYNQTPLQLAILYLAELSSIRCLLERGANQNTRDRRERTPLHYAAQKGRIDVCQLLLSYGAKLDVFDDEKWSPLRMAFDYKHHDIVSYFLECLKTMNVVKEMETERARYGDMYNALDTDGHSHQT
ncbi:poly [ADP-ribose] polymerase tankyrase-like [Artemia franciscana]|uniref:poly [ADP-ribose] polymerase tankyrase-like n=1 Tax=Artemia franciscana TaxID=6661 RepID=UPI0032D9C95C